MTLREQVLASMDNYMIIGQQGYPKEHNDGIDGGDSINRMSHYKFLIDANDEIGNHIGTKEDLPSRTLCDYEEHLNLFECQNSKGNYRRHPERTKHGIAWYCNGTYDGVMSRDQSIPLIIAMGFAGLHKRIGGFFLRHLMRGLLFTTNTRPNFVELKPKKIPDLTMFEFWALYIRSNKITGILLYPLLVVFDIETLIGAIIRRLQPLKTVRKDRTIINDDVINHISICIYGSMRYPTPVMYLANRINSYDDLMEKLKFYCGAADENKWRKIPFFVDLYDPLMIKFIK